MRTAWIGIALVGVLVATPGLAEGKTAAATDPQLGGPANDDCASPQFVTVPSVTAGTTIGAATDEVAACGGQSQTAPGVWYAFVVSEVGRTYRVSTCPGDGGSATFDTRISVYCQQCATSTCVGANDDGPAASCPQFTSRVEFCSFPGLYRILVHGFGAATGNFELSLTEIDAGPCTPQVACSLLEFGACCITSTPPFELGEAPVDCIVTSASDCAASGGVYQDDGSACLIETGAFDYVSSPTTPIPDADPAGIDATIDVPDSFIVGDVTVDIGITHPWIGDLILEVASPSGTSQVIWDQVCSSTDNINATADDAGTETFCAPIAAGPIDGVFYPPALAGEGPLSVFDGENAQGAWTLHVSDNDAGDSGTLQQWSLHFIGATGACAPFECPDAPPGGSGCLECAPGPGGTLAICHFPPGNPQQRHTIEIGPNALGAHCMNHGDTCGPCDEGEVHVHDAIAPAQAPRARSVLGQR